VKRAYKSLTQDFASEGVCVIDADKIVEPDQLSEQAKYGLIYLDLHYKTADVAFKFSSAKWKSLGSRQEFMQTRLERLRELLPNDQYKISSNGVHLEIKSSDAKDKDDIVREMQQELQDTELMIYMGDSKNDLSAVKQCNKIGQRGLTLAIGDNFAELVEVAQDKLSHEELTRLMTHLPQQLVA